MKFVLFCHSLVSDWNHGNAHFLRGVVRELIAAGHDVDVFEPRDGWSRTNLERDHGPEAIRDFERSFPTLRSTQYDADRLDEAAVAGMTAGADVVIVHEWNDPRLVALVGEDRRRHDYRLLFHDTHHRMVTAPDEMHSFDLEHYDGVLAFGDVIRQLYVQRGLADRAWTWHEAADVALFRPVTDVEVTGDLIWIGNWGDDERTDELHEFLLAPVATLGLTAVTRGVRYPESAEVALAAAGIHSGGWIANHRVPDAFAQFRVTVHIPRRPYVEALPGIPTIRPFEAMACGIPLITSPWSDTEHLFRRGVDHLVATSGADMQRMLDEVLHDADLATSLREHGLETILARHTCAHRVEELLSICRSLLPAAADDLHADHTRVAAGAARTGEPRP